MKRTKKRHELSKEGKKGGRITKNKYLKFTTIYKDAEERYAELSKTSQQIEKRISKYPRGKIHVVNNRGNVQYYLRDNPKDKSGKYISKKQEKIISQYLQKKYDEEVLRLVNLEKTILEKYLLKTKLTSETIQKSYSSQPQEIKDKIIPIDISDDDYAAEWLSVPFEQKVVNSDKCIHKSEKGDIVRSKSEELIANALYRANIPYKYECPLVLSNGIIIHPDFTVLNKKMRKEIYWEHRGMMDDREYARHTVLRLKHMERDGIFLGDNLIITEETIRDPLGSEEIELMIKHYLL